METGRDAKSILDRPHESQAMRLSLVAALAQQIDTKMFVCVATYLSGENCLCLYTDMPKIVWPARLSHREERVWSNFHQALVLHTQQQGT